MLRSVIATNLRSVPKLAIGAGSTTVTRTMMIMRTPSSRVVQQHLIKGVNAVRHPQRVVQLQHSQHHRRTIAGNGYRFMSSETPKQGPSKNNSKHADEDMTSNEIMLTPGQKVVAASRLGIWAAAAVFAAACAYYIGKELMPTKMSPNLVFNRALDKVRENSEVTRRFGTPLKGYGRDHGGKREGRRNFIEHNEYVSDDDGSKRVRVRFNLEGPHGNAFCFAEVSQQMNAGEFVYVLVQDKSNGHVITVIDNRAALAANRMTAGNAEATEALNKLLTGGK